jgi:hypothetical protein
MKIVVGELSIYVSRETPGKQKRTMGGRLPQQLLFVEGRYCCPKIIRKTIWCMLATAVRRWQRAFRRDPMRQFEVVEKGIECSAACFQAIVEGFGPFKSSISRLLLAEGIGKKGPDGMVAFDEDGWYPLEKELGAWKRTLDEVGYGTLFASGRRIPRHAVLPPTINDLESSLRSMDVAYHLNHRKHGELMFDIVSGRMLEGIGHYEVVRAGNERRILVTAPGPYPCDYNRGIVTGFAERFEPKARVVQDMTKPDLKQGAESSSYIVTW